MKKCNYCNVDVETDKNFCPLCFNRLVVVDEQTEEFYTIRKTNETTKRTTKFLFKMFLFVSIAVVALCFMINYITSPTVPWGFVVLFGIIYTWVLIGHTILSNRSVFKKVFLQLLSIIAVLFFAERLSLNSWLWAYVFPSISLVASLVLLMLLFISKKRHEYLFGFSFIFLVLLVCSILWLVLKLDNFIILNFINIVVCGLSLAGIWTFGFNEIRAELSKKWHLS